MPTTVEKTIRASGGDYTSLTAWEAANQGDLVAADEVRVAICYNDWPSGLNDTCIIDGSTTDATRYMFVTVATGHRHDGVIGAGFNMSINAGYSACIYLRDAYTIVDGVDAQNLHADGYAFWMGNAAEAVGSVLFNCIGRGLRCAYYKVWKAINCVAWGSNLGFSSQGGYAIFGFFSCLAYSCSTGFRLDSPGTSNRRVMGCIAFDCTTNFTGTFTPGTGGNASDSGAMPHDGNITGVTSADFVSSTDTRLAAGSILIGAGQNLLALAGISTDINDDPRPVSGAWDIGPDQYVSTATPWLPMIWSGTEFNPAAAAYRFDGAVFVPINAPEVSVFDGAGFVGL